VNRNHFIGVGRGRRHGLRLEQCDEKRHDRARHFEYFFHRFVSPFEELVFSTREEFVKGIPGSRRQEIGFAL